MQQRRLFIFVLFLILICFSTATKLEIFEGDSTSIASPSSKFYEINTPPWSIGNLSFPISGEVVFASGCDALSQLPESVINKKWNTSLPKLILFVDQGDGGCFQYSLIFECQKTNWCGAIFVQDIFFYPTGIDMWTMFDRHFSKTDFKVPMVQASNDDYTLFKNLILQSQKNNQTYLLTLTNDPNPWVPMFSSPIFLVIFRILSPIWSFFCLFLICKIIISQYYNKEVKINSPRGINLKQGCLGFHLVSQISRLFFVVDPFQGQQLFTYPMFMFAIAGSLVFEISASILLAFLVRELTQATKSVNSIKNSKPVYLFVILFIAADFYTASLEGFQLEKTEIPSFGVVVLFYAIVDLLLAIWYLIQARRFLKKCSEYEKVVKKQNRKRILLTQTLIMNSVGMITFAVISCLIIVDQIFGNPWGHFVVYALLVTNIQIMSFLQIMLFGGVALDFQQIVQFFKKKSNIFNANETQSVVI